VHSFVFGTRLTNVTRYLRENDVDLALEQVAEQVEDWSGGTRIGRCIEAFNRDWSRRVCGQGALVLLISDGLDRDAATTWHGIAPRAMVRLRGKLLRSSARSLQRTPANSRLPTQPPAKMSNFELRPRRNPASPASQQTS
jgi:uncharacterized protein with von Willebrand factor type A (vWA) domain